MLAISESVEYFVFVRTIHLAFDTGDVVDAEFVRIELLVLHEGDDGTDDKADAWLQQTCHLIAKRLTRSGWQYAKRCVSCERFANDAGLPGSEFGISEDVVKEKPNASSTSSRRSGMSVLYAMGSARATSKKLGCS